MKRSVFVLLLASAAVAPASSAAPGVNDIVRRSVAANETDFRAESQYTHFERDRESSGFNTYQVLMIDGSPYQRLVAENGNHLAPDKEKEEQRKLQDEIARRRRESGEERRARIAKYERDRKRDHEMIAQLTEAFDFRLLGEQTIAGRQCYVLAATPRPGYKPPTRDTEALTGMKGRMWIDTATYQWVKVQAHVFRPVSISGFLARVEPGTRFELEKMPVDNGVWFPRHFAMRANARILGLFSHRDRQDQTFFNYRKIAPVQAAAR